MTYIIKTYLAKIKKTLILILFLITIILLAGIPEQRNIFSISDRMKTYESEAMSRLSPFINKKFLKNKTPDKLCLIVMKEEKLMELWGMSSNNKSWVKIKTYKILHASGTAGPKIKEGDMQVPEGFYKIVYLNPNSNFHLSLRLGYPSKEDILMAKEDGRDIKSLGGDIMIHGDGGSIGCISIADKDVEEIFVLAAKLGIENIKVISMPFDFRTKPMPIPEKLNLKWLPERYRQMKESMKDFIQ